MQLIKVARQTFYFGDGPYLQAMQGLHAALSGSEAFVKFIGQPHTGKSGVCEKLTQFMRLKDYRVIYFDYSVESPDVLRGVLAKELDIPNTLNMLRHLEDALVTDTGKPLVLIFDDAHLLSELTLAEIYRLAGVQVAQKRVINIALCGEPELERRLSRKQEFNSRLQHVSHSFLLEPMNAATTSHFLSAYFEKMELADLQLEPAALNQFYKSCKGYPGPAYSLCRLVFVSRQDSQGLTPITKEELLFATRSADSDQLVSSSLLREGNRWMQFGPVAAVAVMVSLALLARQLNPPELRSEAEEAASLAVDSIEKSSTSSAAASPFAADKLLVSDSTLVSVTAQEKGASNEAITEPLFEQMASNGDPVQLVNVTLTRSMLALDDDEIEIVEEVKAQGPGIDPVFSSLENIAETVPDVAPLERAAIESLPSEPAASESVLLSPQQVVQGWLDAWEGQDLEKYFASYDNDFVPRYHRSKSAWQSNRERVIGNASQISLELSDFMIISEDAESIEVHFWIAYSSPNYKDDRRKKLVLKKLPASDQGAARLVILEEINLEVRV